MKYEIKRILGSWKFRLMLGITVALSVFVYLQSSNNYLPGEKELLKKQYDTIRSDPMVTADSVSDYIAAVKKRREAGDSYPSLNEEIMTRYPFYDRMTSQIFDVDEPERLDPDVDFFLARTNKIKQNLQNTDNYSSAEQKYAMKLAEKTSVPFQNGDGSCWKNSCCAQLFL